MLLITTKNTVSRKSGGKVVDRARLKDNVYDKNEILSNPEDSPFYKAFASAQNIDEAYLSYYSLRDFNDDNMTFYLDAFDFFSEYDKMLATKVISNLLEMNSNDIKPLKTLELYFAKLGNNKMAEMVNNQILNIDADNLQANYKKVMLPKISKAQDQLKARYDLYKKTNGFQNINSELIEKTLKRDIKNFIYKNSKRFISQFH